MAEKVVVLIYLIFFIIQLLFDWMNDFISSFQIDNEQEKVSKMNYSTRTTHEISL